MFSKKYVYAFVNRPARFAVACGDGEYIIYTALSFRNKSFGQALDFVWSADSAEYAIRESASSVKIFKNFKERKVLKPDFSAEGACCLMYNVQLFVISLFICLSHSNLNDFDNGIHFICLCNIQSLYTIKNIKSSSLLFPVSIALTPC